METLHILLLAGVGWLALAVVVHALIIYPILRGGSDDARDGLDENVLEDDLVLDAREQAPREHRQREQLIKLSH
jgi:hypothetical protein